MIMMRYPKGLSKALTLSYDDGVIEDIRLIDIMSKHGLKGTFNINSSMMAEKDATEMRQRLSKKQMLDLYLPSGNEVAVHAYTHAHLEELPPELITEEVLKDRENIENTFGTITRGMAYPFGTYNDTVVDSLKSCGIAYSRTVESTEWFSIPTDWLRMPATCHHANPKLFDLADRFLSLERRVVDPCLLFYLWGHSYEFALADNWDIIEKFAEKMGNRDDIWYATNIEIYDYVQSYNKLRYNIAKTKVHNPTSTDLWISKDGKIIEIKAGQTVNI